MSRLHRHLAAAALAALLAASACAPAAPPTNGNSSAAPPRPPAPAIPPAVDTTQTMPFDFVAVDFVDAKRGWLAGNDAEQNISVVAGTSDGGATWNKLVEIFGDTLLDVDFADERNGWAVGIEGVVYRTTDGGATWAIEPPATWAQQRRVEPITVPMQDPGSAPLLIAESIGSLFFVDGRTGWAAGDTPTGESFNVRGLILGTTDGGATWTELKDASGRGAPFSLNDVWFLDAKRGWAAGGTLENAEEDVLLYTADGGRTWERRRTGTAQYLRAVQFVGDAGWVVGMTIDATTELPGPSRILATRDGGATWEIQYTSPRSFYDVVFADASHGWVVGDAASVWATSDGGKTWAQQTTFAVDAGKTLTRPARPPNAPEVRGFRCLFLLDASSVWAAGDAIVLKRR